MCKSSFSLISKGTRIFTCIAKKVNKLNAVVLNYLKCLSNVVTPESLSLAGNHKADYRATYPKCNEEYFKSFHDRSTCDLFFQGSLHSKLPIFLISLHYRRIIVFMTHLLVHLLLFDVEIDFLH